MSSEQPDTPEALGQAKPKPGISKRGELRAAERAAAQAEALRANLARRKAQARARDEDAPEG